MYRFKAGSTTVIKTFEDYHKIGVLIQKEFEPEGIFNLDQLEQLLEKHYKEINKRRVRRAFRLEKETEVEFFRLSYGKWIRIHLVRLKNLVLVVQRCSKEEEILLCELLGEGDNHVL